MVNAETWTAAWNIYKWLDLHSHGIETFKASLIALGFWDTAARSQEVDTPEGEDCTQKQGVQHLSAENFGSCKEMFTVSSNQL